MIWSLIPPELWLALGGALAAVVAWWGGKRSGKKEARADRAEANAKAAKTAKDTRHEVEISDDQHIVDILTGRRKL